MTTSDDLRRATVDWLGAMHLRMAAARPGDTWFALTFHPCLGTADDVEPEIRLRLWDGCVARLMFGHPWRNRPALKLRPWGALIGQPGVQGFHFHGLLAIPADHVGRFLEISNAALRQVAPFGSLDLPLLQTDQAWREYTTRHLCLRQPTAFAPLPYLNDPRTLPFSAAPTPHLRSVPSHIPLAA